MGPLSGLRVLEIASLAPAPFGCMIMADLGADVLRVDRPTTGTKREVPPEPLVRGRKIVHLDLKTERGRRAVLGLASQADVLVEGFRPGVTERLGLGPEACLEHNPALVYARMTGWGQTGPMAARAGHDINYIAASGALEPIGRAGEPPTVPLNLVGDYGGGGLMMVIGILAALHERRSSGLGQVVDAAMIDGSSLLMTSLHGMLAAGAWSQERGTNLLDSGAPFFDTYETADGKYVSVGAMERRFYSQLIAGLGLSDAELPAQYDRSRWPELRERLAAVFRSQDRDHWEGVFSQVDACVFPVLSPLEAAEHPLAKARRAFVTVDGVVQPAPAPRFSRTDAQTPTGPVKLDLDEAMRRWSASPFGGVSKTTVESTIAG